MVLGAHGNTDTTTRSAAAAATRDLVAWVAEVTIEDIAEEIFRRAALVLADNLAATVAAESEPEVQAAQAKLIERSTAPEATVFNRARPRADRYAAAAANGTAATWCELDEGYRVAPAHAGAYILPALLAEAEATGADTAQVLHALVLSYEIVGRCAQAFAFPAMTVHPHAAFGTLGAAAAIGVLRRQDADALLATVSAGASMVFAGPYNHAIDGALVRNLWTGISAWAGLRAADLAPLGLGGIAESLYDVFVGCFGTHAEPALLTAGLGERWAIASGYHKLFACCQYAHSAVEASLALREKLAASGRSAGDIREIAVATHPRGLTLTEVEPPTVLSAKFSMPHALAAVAARGTGGQAAFGRDTLDDPAIARLRRAVRMEAYAPIAPWPKDRPGRVTWRFADGESWSETVENARGGSDQPFSQDELTDKIETLTRVAFPAMPAVLRGLIADPHTMAATPWRDVVTRMIERNDGR
jgi:2-methylcitrate dehydratase PrpD